jgi:hypothetical protein
MGLFGGKKQDDWEKPNPELDAELERLNALSSPQLAAEVMSKGFSSDYDPSDDGREAAQIAAEFWTPPDFKLRDTTVHAQKRASQEASDPTSIRAKFLELQDLVGEGLQTLEKATLIQQKTSFDGVATTVAFVTTRLGRDALERSAVDRILAGGTL